VIEAAVPATAADVAVLVQLAEVARNEKSESRGGPMFLAREAPPGPHDERLAAAITDENQVVLCGTIDGTIVGFASMAYEKLRTGEFIAAIGELYVLPDARGVGVGEALMDALVAAAQGAGCRGIDAIALPGDRETKNFFETFGLKARAILVHRSLH
jgi:GNAT superfamily N-acetyltransferase